MMENKFIAIGKYDDNSGFREELGSSLAPAKKKIEAMKKIEKVKAVELYAVSDDGKEVPYRSTVTEAIKDSVSAAPGQYLKNEAGAVVYIKDIENSLVIFDEEGTERILTASLFDEYVEQEGYKPMGTKVKGVIREIVELHSVRESVRQLIEANTLMVDIGDTVSFYFDVRFKGREIRKGKIVAVKGNNILLDTGDEIQPRDVIKKN